MKLATAEIGYIEVLAIWERDGRWEEEWEPLRGTDVGSLFTTCSEATLNHALHGFSRPLVRALGLAPSGCLRKIPSPSRECHKRTTCPFYDPPVCQLLSKRMPWCFEAEGIAETETRLCATKAFELWHEGVYLIVVRPDEPAGVIAPRG